MMSDVVLFGISGLPGSGKGETVKHILPKINGHASPIEMSRVMEEDAHVAEAHKAFSASAKLVPDEFVIPAFWRKVEAIRSQGKRFGICDGYPRSEGQINDTILHDEQYPFFLFHLEIDAKTAIERMMQRAKETLKKDPSNKRAHQESRRPFCEDRIAEAQQKTLPMVSYFRRVRPHRFFSVMCFRGRKEVTPSTRAQYILNRIDEFRQSESLSRWVRK